VDVAVIRTSISSPGVDGAVHGEFPTSVVVPGVWHVTLRITVPVASAGPVWGAARSGACAVRYDDDWTGGLHDGSARGAPCVMPGGDEPRHWSNAGTSLNVSGDAAFGRAWTPNAEDAVKRATRQPKDSAITNFLINSSPFFAYPCCGAN
jgi:hypothetical protein